MASVTTHNLLIDTQSIAFSCYNLHFLEDWYVWKMFLTFINPWFFLFSELPATFLGLEIYGRNCFFADTWGCAGED